MQLPANPKLKDVIKICKSSKDVDFLQIFDSSKSGLYASVRHRYNELVHVVANGISHLKLFTKFLKQTIDAQKLSSDTCVNIIEQYKEEEPTLSIAAGGFIKLADETSVTLPQHLQSEENKTEYALHKKTDIDAFSDIFGFERNMGKLLVMYWNRLNTEIYLPLYEYRKTCITKLESIQEYVSDKYDKLIKLSIKLRETKVSTISLWNDLCDAQHTLRKHKSLSNDKNGNNNKTKKLYNKVKSLQNKTKKQFESVVEQVDKFNNIQDEFWNEIIYNACLQLESIEYSRVCYYKEYFDKYTELLTWRKCELQNGVDTLERASKMLMTPFEIAEYNIHPIRISNGNYIPIQAQQYELPCMPNDILSLNGKINEQRIDPNILFPVYNPFGDELKPSTSKHIKSNYSRADSVIIHAHSPQSSISSVHSMGMHSHSLHNASIISLPQSNTHMSGANIFGNANTASKLFSRTNRAQTHNGGLPRLPPQPQQMDNNNNNNQNDTSVNSMNSVNSINSDNNEAISHSNHSSSMSNEYSSTGVVKPPRPAKPPRKALPNNYNGPPRNIDVNKPALPTRSRYSPRNNHSNNSPHRPNLPARPPPNTIPLGVHKKKAVTPTPPNNRPNLPPRRKTLDNTNFKKRKPPSKNPLIVAQTVRKNSFVSNNANNDNDNNNTNNNNNNNKKNKKKWKLGK